MVISGSGAVEDTASKICLNQGTVLFIPANTTFDVTCKEEDMEIYRAYCVL